MPVRRSQSNRTKSRSKTKPSLVSRVPQDGELRLPPEDDNGNIEYKSRLVQPSATRLQHLITQMKWRLQQGRGEAVYEIGVEDDGRMTGLEAAEMSESMHTLCKMANSVGATLVVLNDQCVYGKPGEPDSRRVIETLVRKLPENQQFTDLRVAVLGNAAAGKSTLCGVLTQGVLDNGNGKCRLNLLRYMHEIRTGKTSSVNLDVFGFDQEGQVLNYSNHSLESVLERAAKLVTLIDLAGDRRYMKTTIYGVSGYTPHYCALLVNARVGWTAMSEEHWGLARAFRVPVFVVVTKADLVGESRLQRITHQIQAVLKRNSPGAQLEVVEGDNVQSLAQSLHQNTVVPLFFISNVTGAGLSHLTRFLHQLPQPHHRPHSTTRSQSRSTARTSATTSAGGRPPLKLFHVDEVYRVPEAEVVLCGLVAHGAFNEEDRVQVGPDQNGAFAFGRVRSLRRNRQPVWTASRGETASLAVLFDDPAVSLRRGMVVLSAMDEPVSCRRFTARFQLLAHPNEELCIGFQGTVYVGSLRRTVTIVDFRASALKCGDRADVTFEFYAGVEYVRSGQPIFFRERDTKGTGVITNVL